MNQHTHSYVYWHGHEHGHLGERHAEGHSHLYAMTHTHGVGGKTPHSHKERQEHPTDDVSGPNHHHAVSDHLVEAK